MVDSTAARRDVERWFVERGVPQLVEGYSDEQHMDARATPLILGWLVVASIWWATRPEWPPEWKVAAVAIAVAYMALAYIVLARIRGRRPLERPRTWDLRDILAFGLLPALPVAIVHGPLEGAFVVGRIMLGVGAIYIITGFGLPEIAWSATRRIGSQLEHIVALVSRTLPTLLILVIFLLFAAEIWEAAREMHPGELLLLLALLTLVAVLLIVATLRAEIRRIEARSDWTEILHEASGTPADALIADLPAQRPGPAPFTWLQRANLGLLMLVNQLAQSVFVALVVALFLVAFGLIALPASVQEGWSGGPLREVAHFSLFGDLRMLSGELLVISAVLGGIVGLYFTGLALTDASYRREYFARVVSEVEQIASVRAVYGASRRQAAVREEPAPEVAPA